MKKLLIIALGSMVAFSALASSHYVRPYFKKDGTYVQGHRAGNPGSGTHCTNSVCTG